MEAHWYDKLMLSYGSSTLQPTTSAVAHLKQGMVPYEDLCASCYNNDQPRKTPQYDFHKSTKFRVHKSSKDKNKSVLTIKRNTKKFAKIQDTFRINECTITTNFGIVTEDMFFKSI